MAGRSKNTVAKISINRKETNKTFIAGTCVKKFEEGLASTCSQKGSTQGIASRTLGQGLCVHNSHNGENTEQTRRRMSTQK